MKKITILLAEDHVVVRESIHQSLEREPNFTVVGEAGDGEEAVRMARELKPDVIVMDISLPKINGIEATKQIKAFQPSAIVLGLLPMIMSSTFSRCWRRGLLATY